jgi:hypothetical protein
MSFSIGAASVRQIRCNVKLLGGHVGEVRKGVANTTLVNDSSQGLAENVGVEKKKVPSEPAAKF